MERTKFTDWYNGYKCKKCDEILTYHQKMYSNGRCPSCGFKFSNAVTIVTTIEFAYRYKITKWIDFTFPFFHRNKEIEIKEDI